MTDTDNHVDAWNAHSVENEKAKKPTSDLLAILSSGVKLMRSSVPTRVEVLPYVMVARHLQIESLGGRYLMNSPMMPHEEEERGRSAHAQHSEGLARRGQGSRWLPASSGPICMVMRLT